MNRKPYWSALCVLGLLGGCGGGGGGATPGTGTAALAATGTTQNGPIMSKLSGKIVDANGKPVAGVTVSAFHHNDHTTLTAVTDASGAYAVSGLDTVNNADYAIYASKAGQAFLPAVSDTAGAVGRLDFNGLYRTVIRFIAMPAHDVASANFTALGAGDKVVSLPRTGQTVSYAAGDDAAAQSGVAWPSARFTDNGDGTVSDRLTGLVWLRNAGCFTPGSWAGALTAASQLASGACGLSDGSAAGQWRMPNVNELESLIDVSKSNPAVAGAHPFANINLGTAYWSSTTYTAGTANAMAIRFSDGRWINGAEGSFDNNKSTASNALWAVRTGTGGAVKLLATGVYNSQGGGSFGPNDDASLQLGVRAPAERFIDKGDGTVADTATGLIWLKQGDCIRQTWADAVASVNSLASGRCGLTDGSSAGQWRMPNRSEMLSLSDRAPTFPQASYLNGQYQASSTTTGPVIFNNFIVSDYYWSSTTDAADILQAWAIYSCDFGAYNVAKSEPHYVLAVRQ